jgi:hypothetical protein
MAFGSYATSNSPNLKNLTEFKTKLRGGGARPNLFEVNIDAFPDVIKEYWNKEDRDDFSFLCKAAALPASNVAAIDVPFRGRIFKVAGDRTFDTWTVTIINDEDFNLRHAFEMWMNHISKLDNASGAVNPQSYMTDAIVYQFGRSNYRNGRQVQDEAGKLGQSAPPNTGSFKPPVLRAYKMHDIFPTNVSQIDLSYDTGDTIEEFTVEFQINWFEIEDTSKDSSANDSQVGGQNPNLRVT